MSGNNVKYGEQGTGYASSYSSDITVGSLIAGVATITHGMGTYNIIVSVYDDYLKEVIPDEVTMVDDNTVAVDLTSFGTITGTWKIVVVSANSNPIPVGEVWGNITGLLTDQADLNTALSTYYRPRVLQTAPTTATTGFIGEVVYDVSSNKWTCIKIDGSTYYWAPEGFPDVNTEYASHVEAGTIIYKYRYSVNNIGTTTPLTVNHGIANIGVFKPIGSDCYVGTGYNSIRKGFYTATNHYIQFTVTTTQIVTSFATPTFNSTAVSTEFYYTKTA